MQHVSSILWLLGFLGLGALVFKLLKGLTTLKQNLEDAQIIDLTKKISEKKILIDGKERTAQELLREFQEAAKKYHEFDTDDDPNGKPTG